MKRWQIFRYDPETKTATVLGNVLAANSPAAILKGFKKYSIPPECHRRIGARPLFKVEKSTLPEAELRELKRITASFNKTMKGSA